MKVEKYSYNGLNITQRIQLDSLRETEVLRYDDSGVVLVFDFPRVRGRYDFHFTITIKHSQALTAAYVPELNECFLRGAIDQGIASPFHVEKTAMAPPKATHQRSVRYPVMDHSVLPPHLSELCRHKSVSWVERTSAIAGEHLCLRKLCVELLVFADETQRAKRHGGFRICVHVCTPFGCGQQCWP
jgi:hypothetical protein